MTIANALPLQGAVYSAITGALSGAGENLPVFDYVPSNPPAEYVRIDGLSGFDRSFKDNERLEHAFQVSVFRESVSGTTIKRGNKRVGQLLLILHNALKDLRFDRGRVRFETYSFPSDDPVGTAHAWARYTIVV